ncbi:methionyl-tRNA formyltransferase [Natronomonas sp. F2-12]|uniref:Methionyl-tRNA formyltransferase n=1 Tax=Natronomonas aquatica TaxID=2841590 RepID=A0A9R1CTX0_9EURY|nr:methionyl-tRNA formyltransferase [Natronomonas aquatica]MCQ4333830.1 methionyl-tRNA formyltransferase [Natronomonas aquatica]
MRTVIVGNRKMAWHLLRHTLDEGWNIVGAIVPKGDLAAKQANFVPFSELVAGTDCQLHKVEDINNAETLSWLQGIDPDICLSGGWSQIIKKRILNIPERGFLGLHSSCLPAGRGGAPVNWSIISGADKVGISLFYYEPGVDAGDIVAQGSVPVEYRDDIATVFDELANEACQLISSVQEELRAANIDTAPQSLSDATYRPRRQPQDGIINWNHNPTEQYNWIRAQTEPYPGAYTFYQGEQLTVWEGKPVDISPRDTATGEVLAVGAEEGIDVRTGDGAFRITRIKASDRPSRWADRYARGIELSPGDRLGRHHAPDTWRYTGIRGTENTISFDTNLKLGKSGEITVVSFAKSNYNLDVFVSLNGNRIFEDSVTVSNEYRENVRYRPTETGTHSIKVRFEEDGELLDTRYLKVFVH